MPTGSADGADTSNNSQRRLLEEKLDPRAIRLTIGVSGVLQMVHELIKRSVVEQVHQFFWCGISDGELQYDEERYSRSVLDLVVGLKGAQRKFQGSMKWLVKMGAITPQQAEKLDEVYALRHMLTHELASFLINVDREIDPALIQDALEIFRDIEKFWIEVEISIGTFDHLSEVSSNEVASGSLLLIQACLDAVTEEWELRPE